MDTNKKNEREHACEKCIQCAEIGKEQEKTDSKHKDNKWGKTEAKDSKKWSTFLHLWRQKKGQGFYLWSTV